MSLIRNHGVTAPAGFKASAVDGAVAVLVNEGPDLAAAGVFSGTEQPSADELWTKQVLTSGRLRAVLLHAGSPSAALSDDFALTHHAAESLAVTLSDWGTSTGAGEVGVCATGGNTLPSLLEVVAEAVYELAGGITGGFAAARVAAGPQGAPTQAVMQHDDGWTVGGLSSSAGSVHVLSTDAVADAAVLLGALNTERPAGTTALLLASGASEIRCDPAELNQAVAAVRKDLRAQTPEAV